MTAQKQQGKTQAEQKLDAIMNSEVSQFAEWKGNDGKKHKATIKVEDPGIDIATQAIDCLEAGDDESDFTTLFGLIMDHVLDDPSYTYDQLDADLPKSSSKKVVTLKNKQGVSVHVKMVFPGYRKAIQLVMAVNGPSGRSRINDTLNDLNDEVLRKENDEVADMDYWSAGGHGDGLGMKAYNEAMKWLGEILNEDGFLPKLTAALTYLFRTVRQG